jgi:hypothetical protein
MESAYGMLAFLGCGSRQSTDSNLALKTTIERFEREIASRSLEENRAEAAALQIALTEAEDAGIEGRIEILSLELQMIQEALETRDGAHDPGANRNAGGP